MDKKISNSIVGLFGFEKGKSIIWSESEFPNPTKKINQPIIYTKNRMIYRQRFLLTRLKVNIYIIRP
ncbi:MAG: hypothetical protein H6613_01925 [Ignavibacteriales bacterium]|nr:hypothetical protein [Ignavibacteriales bacterium]